MHCSIEMVVKKKKKKSIRLVAGSGLGRPAIGFLLCEGRENRRGKQAYRKDAISHQKCNPLVISVAVTQQEAHTTRTDRQA